MILYPAVDILDGQAVRLARGDFDEPTVYQHDPREAARAWLEAGAQALHVVDLDGARAGEPRNLRAIGEIAALADVPVQVGGGLRTAAHVRAVLEDAGAARAVVGTAAYRRGRDFLEALVQAHGERLAVAVDVRGGRVAAAGWTQDTGLGPLEAVAWLAEAGVRWLVYTNVDRDGMLAGPDLEEARRVAGAVDGQLIWSGGVGEVAHLRALAGLPLAGVIVGKALYEGRFTLAEANAALA